MGVGRELLAAEFSWLLFINLGHMQDRNKRWG